MLRTLLSASVFTLLLTSSRPLTPWSTGRLDRHLSGEQLSLELASPAEENSSPVAGSGGKRESNDYPSSFASLWADLGILSSEWAKLLRSGLEPLGARFLGPLAFETESQPLTLVSDGQFVWGPNAGSFDPEAFLTEARSPLAPYADDIHLWSGYSSVNPMVLLATLELKFGLVAGPLTQGSSEEVRTRIEETAMELAVPFYEHLYKWGDRRPDSEATPSSAPFVALSDGNLVQMEEPTNSGSYAVAASLAADSTLDDWQRKVTPSSSDGFAVVFAELFPGVDPLDPSNNINPATLPPDDLFQFPYPLGASWNFNGPHNWNGGSFPPPFSSMDFFAGAAAPPALFTVAAASGIAARPWGYTCWLEINHGSGWTTSYYHLQNTYVGGTIGQNGSVGVIAEEICAGGFATGPHVHFSLKFNGAYASLEGVKLSGWTIHVGLSPYTSGTIERDGVHLTPGAQVLNDYHLRFPREDTSLRFFANGQAGADRVTIQLDAPPRPADVGSDFTLEWWMKALPGDNQSTACAAGAAEWREGNIVIDRDIRADGEGGEFGISLADGRIAFGLSDGISGITLCGTRKIDDRAWHHIAVTRSFYGPMRIFVDGKLDAEGVGPSGDISYPDGRETEDVNDPFLVIGAEKHNLGPPFLGFQGWIDEIRISDGIVYTGEFLPPTGPLSVQASTLALYSFNEGTGDMIWEVSGYAGGPSNGSRLYGGSPAGPEWSGVAPFGNIFTDVFGSHWAYDYIEALADEGLATGYPDGSYRPANNVTRAEAAVFLEKGIHGASFSPDEPGNANPLNDIAGHWAEGWVAALYDDGLTAGYPDGSFRPDGLVERDELAVFLLRATHGQGYAPPPADGNHPFSDIQGHWAEAWIQQLWQEGLTAGYPDSSYRPDAAVTRAEIAIFLVQAFGLPLP